MPGRGLEVAVGQKNQDLERNPEHEAESEHGQTKILKDNKKPWGQPGIFPCSLPPPTEMIMGELPKKLPLHQTGVAWWLPEDMEMLEELWDQLLSHANKVIW